MGNSIETGILHDKTDWGWEESDEEWPETVNREEKNKRKKEDCRLELQAETATKAGNMLGCHPIRQESIDNYHNISGDYLEAKEEAAKEIHANYLMQQGGVGMC